SCHSTPTRRSPDLQDRQPGEDDQPASAVREPAEPVQDRGHDTLPVWVITRCRRAAAGPAYAAGIAVTRGIRRRVAFGTPWSPGRGGGRHGSAPVRRTGGAEPVVRRSGEAVRPPGRVV